MGSRCIAHVIGIGFERDAHNRRPTETVSTSILRTRQSQPSPRSCLATSLALATPSIRAYREPSASYRCGRYAKSDIVFVLENALRLSGVVLLHDTAGYRLTPLGDAVGAGRVDAAGASPEPGFGVSVVPLQYVSAQTMLKLMDSFATKAGSVRADVTRNILLIQGTGAERRTAVDTALSFDVDWMRGQSVGIFPISSGPPAPLIAELEDHRFRRKRSQPERHQTSTDRPAQCHHGGEQEA